MIDTLIYLMILCHTCYAVALVRRLLARAER
jgi:hypothetical protein